MSLNTIRY